MAETDGKITQSELGALFGASIPMEAVRVLYEPGEKTVQQVRVELAEIAQRHQADDVPLAANNLRRLADMAKSNAQNKDAEGAFKMIGDLAILLEALARKVDRIDEEMERPE